MNFTLIGFGLGHSSSGLEAAFSRLRWLIVSWLCLDISFSAIVTAGQLYFLWCRRMSAFACTANVLDKAMMWTIRACYHSTLMCKCVNVTSVAESGAATSAVYLAVLISYLSSPNSWLWAGISLMLPGVYANAMLALLNGRRVLTGMIADAAQECNHLAPSQPSVAFDMTRTYGVSMDSDPLPGTKMMYHDAIATEFRMGTPSPSMAKAYSSEPGATGAGEHLSCPHHHHMHHGLNLDDRRGRAGISLQRCPMAAAFMPSR